MMATFFDKLVFQLNKISQLRVLRSIMDGFFFAMPIIVIGAAFQIVTNIATAAQGGQAGLFIFLTNLTFGLMGLFTAFGISHAHANRLKIDPMSTAVVGTTMFLILSKPIYIEQGIMDVVFQIDSARLGASGMLLAVIAGISTAEVMAFFLKRGWAINAESLPDFAKNWFSPLIPSVLLIFVAWAITYLFDFDITSQLSGFISSILTIGNSYLAFIGLWTFACLLFVLGIHPVGIIAAFIPLLMGALAENAEMAASGLEPVHINNMGTAFAFVFLGGVGSTLALNFLMLRSKSESIKGLGKIALLPSILNINEPLIFGLPIAYNPILAIPFVINGGIVTPTIVYLAMRTGFVAIPHTMNMIPFMPAGLGAFFLNNDWRSFILIALILVVNALVWLPFFKRFENQSFAVDTAEVGEVVV